MTNPDDWNYSWKFVPAGSDPTNMVTVDELRAQPDIRYEVEKEMTQQKIGLAGG